MFLVLFITFASLVVGQLLVILLFVVALALIPELELLFLKVLGFPSYRFHVVLDLL